jgi:hypothetical protein
MAQRVEVLIIDDLDGSPADQTVAFALDGSHYQIDLSSQNAARLREALAPWQKQARKLTNRRQLKRTDLGPSNQVLRAWAQANGHQVAPRGRVPEAVRTAYEQQHS